MDDNNLIHCHKCKIQTKNINSTKFKQLTVDGEFHQNLSSVKQIKVNL